MFQIIATLAAIWIFVFFPRSAKAQSVVLPDGRQDVTVSGEEAMKLDIATTYPTLQQELAVNDDDYAILMPKIYREIRAVDMVGSVGFANVPKVASVAVGVPWRQRNLIPVEYARYDLRETIQDINAPASAIASKLAAFRAAKAKALADLRIAREDLRANLTVRQEAIMVMHRILD